MTFYKNARNIYELEGPEQKTAKHYNSIATGKYRTDTHAGSKFESWHKIQVIINLKSHPIKSEISLTQEGGWLFLLVIVNDNIYIGKN